MPKKIFKEKATSKAQQKLMGMVHAYQKGELKGDEVSDEVKNIAKKMKYSDVKDFASTKHDDLPTKKESFDDLLESMVYEVLEEIAMPTTADGMIDGGVKDKDEEDLNEALPEMFQTGEFIIPVLIGLLSTAPIYMPKLRNKISNFLNKFKLQRKLEDFGFDNMEPEDFKKIDEKIGIDTKKIKTIINIILIDKKLLSLLIKYSKRGLDVEKDDSINKKLLSYMKEKGFDQNQISIIKKISDVFAEILNFKKNHPELNWATESMDKVLDYVFHKKNYNPGDYVEQENVKTNKNQILERYLTYDDLDKFALENPELMAKVEKEFQARKQKETPELPTKDDSPKWFGDTPTMPEAEAESNSDSCQSQTIMDPDNFTNISNSDEITIPCDKKPLIKKMFVLLRKENSKLKENEILESEYQGKKVKLNTIFEGDVRQYKVYMKSPTDGIVKKINFGPEKGKLCGGK